MSLFPRVTVNKATTFLLLKGEETMKKRDGLDKAHFFAWATTLHLHPLSGLPEQ